MGVLCLAVIGCRMGVELGAGDEPVAGVGSGLDGAVVGSLASISWPERLEGRATGGVRRVEPGMRIRGELLSTRSTGRPIGSDDADARLIAGLLGRTIRFRAEEGGSLVFRESEPDPRAVTRRREGPAASVVFRFVSARPSHGDGDVWVLERTWFALYEPSRQAEPPPGGDRGLVVLLPGLFGSPGFLIGPLVEELVASGYVVLRAIALPSRYRSVSELGVSVGSEVDREVAFGRAIASDVDERLASVAYAVEGAVGAVVRSRPHLDGAPTGLITMSGSALAGPAVWARTPGRYDAVVMIAGGANLLRVRMRSLYTEWPEAVRLRVEGPGATVRLGERDLRGVYRPGGEMDRAYLASSELDPYALAPLLRASGTPVLVVHAGADRAVPAETGELLWERLGSPERWSWPVGHELLFVTLPGRVREIVGWMDGRLGSSGAGG